jgi:hypothetical protein
MVGVALQYRDVDWDVELDEAKASRCAYSTLDPSIEARKNLAFRCSVSQRLVWTAIRVKNL